MQATLSKRAFKRLVDSFQTLLVNQTDGAALSREQSTELKAILGGFTIVTIDDLKRGSITANSIKVQEHYDKGDVQITNNGKPQTIDGMVIDIVLDDIKKSGPLAKRLSTGGNIGATVTKWDHLDKLIADFTTHPILSGVGSTLPADIIRNHKVEAACLVEGISKAISARAARHTSEMHYLNNKLIAAKQQLDQWEAAVTGMGTLNFWQGVSALAQSDQSKA